ncbi:MAG: trigger factor [Spirochaetales bacterium]|nr:trigger factor [Spirochaetales bacterium]MBQ2124761.1 trigger factor [Spirochaetales bacterium]
MELKFETEKKEDAKVLLTITVAKDEIQKSYKKTLADTQKNIVMNGFRKGKVPVSILEMKFKKAMLEQVAHNLVDEAYRDVFSKLEEKPLATSEPSLEDLGEVELDKDFVFKITYETFPEIKFGEYKNVEVEKEEIEVSDKDVADEVSKYLAEFSTIETKEGELVEGDIACVEYKVFEDGKEVESKDKEYVHIGKEYDKYKLSKDLLGVKNGEEKEITKTFDKDALPSVIAGKTFTIKAKVSEIKYEKKPELTDDLAKQIDKNVATAEEFKNKLKENMTSYANDLTKQKMYQKIMDKVLESFEGAIPASMLNAELKSYFDDILQRVGGDEKRALAMLKLEGFDSKEAYLDSMKDKAERSIKELLVMHNIVKKENFEVSEDDMKKFFDTFAKMYGTTDGNALYETYKKSGQLGMFEDSVKQNKARDFICDSAKITKTNKVSIADLNK